MKRKNLDQTKVKILTAKEQSKVKGGDIHVPRKSGDGPGPVGRYH